MVAVAKLPESRTYNRRECITFRKTAERFGGLSNMAGGYPLNVNGVKILTSEALYQACRFPHLLEVQRLIIAERSPMTAKMKSKPYRDNSRPNWDIVRTKVMRWCLQVKLVQNWDKFSRLLLETGDLPIVEDSRKDDFWGAKPEDEETLTGINVLGRLLMQLREQVKSGEMSSQAIVKPLAIPEFLLYGQEIRPISANGECHLVNYEDSSDVDKVASQSASELVSCDISAYNLNLNEKNDLDSDFKNRLVDIIEPKFNKHDAFHVMLPHIESVLKVEHTDKELAKLFEVPSGLMRNWLERAVRLGKVKKLSRPVRYIAEFQLSLLSCLTD